MADSQRDPLIASLNSVAEQMRHCANVTDQFAQMLTQAPFNGNPLMSPVAAHAGNKRLGMEEEDVEGATKKRRIAIKKARDPDAPKRAASSYIFFQNDLRQVLRKKYPDINSTELMARVSKQWATLTPEQKAPYERLQAEAKQKWETEKRAYDERRGIVAPAKRAGQPVDPATVGPPVPKLARKPSESSDSSVDTSSSDKSEGEEDGASGNSGEEDEDEEDDKVEEELPVPSPPPTKSKAKRKAEIATATTTAKPKSMASSSAAPIPARQEKKKRSNV
ncbi:hypothetical protein BJV78DRAFT_1153193 [Lactifluus subvellereus]|nr:hypothetical protein BJV78DRAFT_1153193 [Lactifluus subvellereus]